jgi:two-component system cell cycle sensor histidine kinase/response regulator CckA
MDDAGGTPPENPDAGLGSTEADRGEDAEARARQQKARAEALVAEAHIGSRSGTILVLDDEAIIRAIVTHILEAAGYRVLTANDGHAAVEVLRREPVDLLLSDGGHPGPSGVELHQLVDSVQPGVAVLWMSNDDYLHLGLDAHFIHKPFTGEELLTAVDKALSDGFSRTVSDFSPDATFMCDPTGRILDANRTACERLRYSRAELLTMTLADITAPELAVVLPERMTELLSQGSVCFETAHRGRDGVVFPVEINATLVDPNWRKTIVASARDISARKRAEAERSETEARQRQEERLEAFARLAGGMALDFNNLLTVIIGYTELALEELPADDGSPADPAKIREVRGDLEQIGKAADRMLGLTRQMLTFARRIPVQPQVVDLGELVRGMEPTLTRIIGEKVKLVTVTPEGTGSVMADPGQIELALVNLATNARDAMPDGGTLTIEVAEFEAAPTQTSPQAGPLVRLSVTDTGADMDAETISHVFEPYSTTKHYRNLRLTLAAVFGIVRQAGGDIRATSEPGHGTTFTVSLPRVAGTTGDGSGPPLAGSSEGRRTGTILILEDDAAVRRFASHVLETQGYRVLTAEHGDSAIELLKREPVQLLITDAIHPGPTGSELASKVAAAQPGTPLLHMFGSGTKEQWVRHGWLQPGGHFLRKPFTRDALVAAADKAIATATPPNRRRQGQRRSS